MAELAAISAARVATARNDARDLREKQAQVQRDLDKIRQQQIDRRQREIDDQSAARQRRFEDLRGDVRTEDQLRRNNQARDQTFADSQTDERFARLQSDIREELRVARDRDFVATPPPRHDSEATGTVQTAQEFADAQAFGAPRPLEPFGLPPLAEPPAPPSDLFDTGPAGVTSAEGIAAVDSLDQGPGPVPFAALERERSQRLAGRVDAERDFQIQQQIDLQDANDRIANARIDPNAPPGTIVDVFG